MDLSQSEQVTTAVPAIEQLRDWAAAALGCEINKTFAMRIVSLDEMTDLNDIYAGKHKPTNVLSFPAQDALEDIPEALKNALDAEIDSLGDIAVCADVVAAEAMEQGKTPDAHWAHMIVHGVLHLRGYDHVRENDAQAMEAEEARILASLGFADPYRSDNTVILS